VDGVTITSSFRGINSAWQKIPLGKTYIGKVRYLSAYSNSEYYNTINARRTIETLVITDYAFLENVFNVAVEEKYENFTVKEAFSYDVLEDNFIVAIRRISTDLPFYWFDCKFVPETDELHITPVIKSTVGTGGMGDISIANELNFVIIPRSLLPDGYDLKNLTPVVETRVRLENSSMPDPLSAGGEITVTIVLNVDYTKDSLAKEIEDSTKPKDLWENVYKILYDKNAEYIKKLGLEEFEVIINTAAPTLYVGFENRCAFMEYKSFFDALAESEYVRKLIVS